MNDILLLLDFDRTLFDSGRFSERVWSVLSQQHGIDKDTERQNGQQFHTYQGDLYDYDFFAHLSSLNIGEIDTLSNAIRTSIEHENFLFPDASAALALADQYETRILTFGNEPFQRFKLSFCPIVHVVPIDIIVEPKGDYLRERYTDRKVVLVDDKMLADLLPEHVRFIHLDRHMSKRVEHFENYVAINTLEAVKEVL